jgi:hypothetical protein
MFKRLHLFAIVAMLSFATTAPAQELTPQEAESIAVDAYVYGYPLVTMEMTRRVMTNVAEPVGTHAPMGQLVRMKTYPSAQFRDVTAPNADTLYTTGWFDVGKEPWVVSIPDVAGRYYLFPMLDGWTNVFQVPGKRTTGTGAITYAITGPNWKGKLPEGVIEYKSPTNMVWILGRIYCTGTEADYAEVHKIQSEIKVTPLSFYGKPYEHSKGKVDPTIDSKTPVRDQVNNLDVQAYFNLLTQLMKDNPPFEADAPMLKKMARLGIEPGKAVDFSKLDGKVKAALTNVPKIAFEKIMGHFASAGKHVNGWTFTTNAGVYGSDYLQRALLTAIGLGANRPQDAIYPTSQADAEGQPYDGKNNYVIRIPAGQLPPVKGFWSLTMYNAEYFFVENELNRQTLSARDNLKKNADGSIDLYLQNKNPGPDKVSNWLPAPEGKFVLMLRLYWPQEEKPSIIDGSWLPPAAKIAK